MFPLFLGRRHGGKADQNKRVIFTTQGLRDLGQITSLRFYIFQTGIACCSHYVDVRIK